MADPIEPGICAYLLGEHPAHPGWNEWRLTDDTRYNSAVIGLTLVRRDTPLQVRTRIFPRTHLTNMNGMVHGAVTMALIDIAMFASASILCGKDYGLGLTVEISTQFVGAGDPQRPLDAVTELVRETGRLIFERGMVMQDDDVIASFSGILRKPSLK